MADINISKLKLPNDNNTYHYKDTVSGYKSTDATQSEHGLLSTTDKIKLDGIATGAEVNQNAFSNVAIGASTISADSKTDTLTLVGGANITLTPDATNDKITISLDDTVDTGEVIATDIQAGNLIVNGTSRFLNTINGTASNSEKLNGQSLTSTYSSTGTAPITGAAVASAIGTLDGTVSGSPSASKTLTAFSQTDGKVSATFGNISITKSQVSDFPTLGTAAAKNYTTSVTSGSADLVTSGAVWTAIDNLPEPMVFKGSLGTGGTITTLPVDGTAKVGDTYKVITAGTYASKAAKVGDTFICLTKTSSANTWELIPSGDEPSGTVTSVGISNGGGLSVSGSPITSSGTITISHADTSSQASVNNSGRTYIQDITLDTYGHVTGIASATETVVNTDRYVNSAAFAHDSTNDNVKMTLTRAGSDTATVTANIPKVSSSSAGVAPKGATVSSQSQTTKFLREDGTWQAPSYTPVIDNLTSSTSTTSALSAKQGYLLANGSARDNTKLPLAGGTMTGRLSTSKPIGQILTGTGTAAQDKGSGVTNRYVPAKWTFNTGLTATDGDIITIKIPVAGHDYGVYLSIDNGTTYYPIVCNSTGRLTTHYPVNNYITLVYEPGGSAASMFPLNGGDARVTVTGGVWRVINYYDSNSNDTAYYTRRIYPNMKTGSNKIFPYTMIMQNSDGRWESIVTSSSTGTSKARNTHGFRLGTILLHYGSGTYNENDAVPTYNIWSMHSGLIDHRYSFNTANNSTSGTTGYKPVYIVGSINATDGLFYLDATWWTQTLPTSDNGKLYIYIGDAYDYYRLTFVDTQKIYWYKDGKVQEYSQSANYAVSAGSATSATTASKLGSSNVGSATQPIYLSAGTATACTYTLGKSVPSDAKFTDTTYSAVTTSANGLMLATDKARFNKIGSGHFGTTGDYRNKKIKIKINSTSSWMLCFTVTLYQNYRATKVMISGYQYGSNHWHQPEARLLGDSDGTETISVYFGYDSVNNLWVGFDGDLYTGVVITDVVNGYSQISDFSDLFTISTEDSLATLQTTVTASSRANYAISAGSASTATSATTASRVSATAGTADANRHVWFSDGSTETARCYDDDFKYNPSTNVLTVSSITGSAAKLGSSNVGSATNPIYLASGTATACTYSLNKTVPSDAVFTDQYVSQSATTTSDYRKIVLSYQNGAAGAAVTSNTNVVYVTANAEVQPSTGNIRSAGTVSAANVSASGNVSGTTLGVISSSGTGGGISLYNGTGNVTTYGIAMRRTTDSGKHGYVQGDWGIYNYMSGGTTRGWVWRYGSTTNVASISSEGHAAFTGSVTIGANETNTSGVRQIYNSTTKSLDFVFVA